MYCWAFIFLQSLQQNKLKHLQAKGKISPLSKTKGIQVI